MVDLVRYIDTWRDIKIKKSGRIDIEKIGIKIQKDRWIDLDRNIDGQIGIKMQMDKYCMI